MNYKPWFMPLGSGAMSREPLFGTERLRSPSNWSIEPLPGSLSFDL
jgi:hypothetical protein